MIKKIAKGTGYLSIGGFACFYGTIYYNSDSFTDANSKLLKVAYRGSNLAIMGTKMACIYTVKLSIFNHKFSTKSMHEKHLDASQAMN